VGIFGKIVDIGLFDQVPHVSIRSYLEYAFHALLPGGMLLMDRTTRRPGPSRKGAEMPFLESPGIGGFPLLSSELQMAESAGFQIMNVEDLSEDYRWTLHHWVGRLRYYAEPLAETGNRQFRSWLFCLLDTAAKLDVGEVQLEQVLLRRVA
jgi:cyclopropane fatty-acyl-phospholipid synthase-like methyltransferase